uniref:Uncharacterized protein n=1 Tax=Tetraselmis sp. GSL018 TaxID=582737 RepID=A0A061QT86_9CHLO
MLCHAMVPYPKPIFLSALSIPSIANTLMEPARRFRGNP